MVTTLGGETVLATPKQAFLAFKLLKIERSQPRECHASKAGDRRGNRKRKEEGTQWGRNYTTSESVTRDL